MRTVYDFTLFGKALIQLHQLPFKTKATFGGFSKQNKLD